MSIIVPTYNESGNILNLIEAIKDNLQSSIFTEIIVVDDNSPDGTGRIVEGYIQDAIRTKRTITSVQQNDIKENDDAYDNLKINDKEKNYTPLGKLTFCRRLYK